MCIFWARSYRCQSKEIFLMYRLNYHRSWSLIETLAHLIEVGIYLYYIIDLSLTIFFIDTKLHFIQNCHQNVKNLYNLM